MSHKLQINKKYKNFENDLLNVREIFKNSDNSIHKARNELKIIELHGIKCVIKSFKIPHLLNRVAYTFFREGKAKKSFLNATKLMSLDVLTPEPIGIIEFFKDSLLNESYFISVYEPYDFTIREVFHHKVDNVKTILQEFARFTLGIHAKGVWHVDYSLGNILITKKENEYRFSLVDINRMQFKEISPREGLKNFNKFWAKDKDDLATIATEYAKESHFDIEEAKNIVLKEAKKLEASVNLKRRLKERL